MIDTELNNRIVALERSIGESSNSESKQRSTNSDITIKNYAISGESLPSGVAVYRKTSDKKYYKITTSENLSQYEGITVNGVAENVSMSVVYIGKVEIQGGDYKSNKSLYVGSNGKLTNSPSGDDWISIGTSDNRKMVTLSGGSGITPLSTSTITVGSFKLWDTDKTNVLNFKWDDNDIADRILTFKVASGNREFDLRSDTIINQDLATFSEVEHLSLTTDDIYAAYQSLEFWAESFAFTASLLGYTFNAAGSDPLFQINLDVEINGELDMSDNDIVNATGLISQWTNDVPYLTTIAGEDHSTLSDLDWSLAGHVIDIDFDLNGNSIWDSTDSIVGVLGSMDVQTDLDVGGDLAMTGLISIPDGALGAGTAAIYFTGDSNTGIYRAGTDTVGIMSTASVAAKIHRYWSTFGIDSSIKLAINARISANAGTNDTLYINGNGTGLVAFNYDSGTGGTKWYDGAAGEVASLTSAGLFTAPTVRVGTLLDVNGKIDLDMTSTVSGFEQSIDALTTITPDGTVADINAYSYESRVQNFDIGAKWIYHNWYVNYIGGSFATTGRSIGFNARQQAFGLTGNVGYMNGFVAETYIQGTSTGDIGEVTNFTCRGGFYDIATCTSSITTWKQASIEDVQSDFPITTLYGLHIEEMTAGTTNWSIYSVGGDNYLGGDLDVGGDVTIDAGGSLNMSGGDAFFADSYGPVWGTGNDCKAYYTGSEFRMYTSTVAASDYVLYCGTAKTLELGTAVWDDQQVVLGTVGLGSVFPDWEDYKGSQVLAFDDNKEEMITFTMQFSHKYKYNSEIEFHIHNAPSDNNTGDVKWTLTVSIADINGTFPAESTFTATQTIAANSQDDHILFEISSDIGDLSGVSGVALCSLTRNGTDIADTYPSDVYLVALDAHIELDTIGSRTETTK